MKILNAQAQDQLAVALLCGSCNDSGRRRLLGLVIRDVPTEPPALWPNNAADWPGRRPPTDVVGSDVVRDREKIHVHCRACRGRGTALNIEVRIDRLNVLLQEAKPGVVESYFVGADGRLTPG